MVKYQIEGNINFYEELYKSLDDEENNQEDNLCLITNAPLTNPFVEMECGHKFNYEALYNDVLNHKKKYNNMERCILKTFEIRCPYCRKVQKNLLPYYQELGLEKVHGVNYIDELIQIKESTGYSNKWEHGVCCFECIDDTQNIVVSCNNTQVMLVEPTGKKYCYQHRYIAQKQFIAKKRLELRQKQKLEKMNAKLEAKKEKDLEKANIKKQKLEEKMKLKEENTNKKQKITKTTPFANLNENVVVSLTNPLTQCNQILKTGKNKGQYCGCKVFKDNLCTRHYNLTNKTTEETNEIVL
jgi:hypothetical protein